jgi:predicted dehydrogenase
MPDLISVAGKWDESALTQKNATLHFRLRRGQPFPGEPVLEWTIQGEKGEIRIISPESAFLQVSDATVPRVIEIHDFASNEVSKVEWKWEGWQEDLPPPARGIGALYESLAEVKTTGAKEKYLTFDAAVKRHELLENLLADWKA